MTGIVIIDFTSKEKEGNFSINYLALAGRCEMHITIDKNEKINDFLQYNQDKENYLTDKISSCESLINEQETYWKKEYELLSMLKDGKRNFLSYVDEVEFLDFTKEISEYISANKELQSKKIKILKEYRLDEKNITNLKQQSKNIKNIYFSFETIPECISLENAEKYLNLKNVIVDQTNKYEYSQLEKVMYIYDKVKEYKCPDVFQLIIQQLGIKTKYFVLSHMDKGLYKKHGRSLVHINDEKYNVNGIFFFDPKLELNECDKRKSNVNNYKFFAKNIEMMEYYDLYKKYIDITDFPALSEMKNENVHNKYLSSARSFARMPIEIGITLNNLFELFDKKTLEFPLNYSLNENDDITNQSKYYYTNIEGKKRTVKNKITKYVDMFYKTIDSKILMAVLSYVRDIESKENIRRYKHDYEDLIKASINSDWGTDTNTKISKNGKEKMEILFNWIDDNESEIDELPVDNIDRLLENKKYRCDEIETCDEEQHDEIVQEEPENNEIMTNSVEVEIPDYELPLMENEKEIFEDDEDLIFDEKLMFDENFDIDDSKEDINIYIKNCLNAILSDNDDEFEQDDKNDKK